MAITVGIHNNAVISSTKKNDKSQLVIQFKLVKELTAKEKLNRATIDSSNDNAHQDFVIFAPNFTSFDGSPKTAEEVEKEFNETQDMLTYIISQYKPVSEIAWDIAKGISDADINSNAIFKQEPLLTKLYTNLTDQFIAQMTKFVGETGKKFRVIFPRTSVKSNYPSLRKRYLGSYGFMEPMTVPAESTTLKFSKYELEKGFDKADAVAPSAAPNADKLKADAAKFKSVFGQPATQPSI